jgi:glucan 1,3-beta-glucosidase
MRDGLPPSKVCGYRAFGHGFPDRDVYNPLQRNNGGELSLHRLFAVPAFALAAVLAFGFWSWMGRSIPMPDAPGGRLQCLSYTPYDGGSSPLSATYSVREGHILADLKALHPFSECIRTYSSIPPQDEVVRVADELGMKVYLGIWISANAEDNAKEIDAALALARAHPDAIKAIVVGNEVMLRREMTGEQLAAIIRDVKAKSGLPVTYADIFEFWRRNPVLADAVDFMSVHILPHWDDPAPVSIDEVQDHVRRIIERTQKTFPGKKMIIGEIGWPSAGRTRGAAVPSLVNQARFIREFVGRADALGVPYNLIEAVDQGWKRNPEGTVGGYWGLLDSDRALKFPLTGPVSEWPHWRQAMAVSLALTAIVMLWGLLPGRRIGFVRWMLFGVLAQVLGTTLVLQAVQTDIISLNILEYLRGAALSVLTVAGFALIVLPRLDNRDPHRVNAVPAPLVRLLTWMRRPSRAGLAPDIALGLVVWPTLAGGALAALLMAVDGRHRDFLIPEFWLLAVFILFHWLRSPRRIDWLEGRREEGWMALILVCVGPFAWDGPRNIEAMAWIAVAVALALPWLAAAVQALRVPAFEPRKA